MFNLYSFLSFIGLITILIILFSDICKDKILCISIFSLFAFAWILNLGFSGHDMIVYLEASENYSFNNPGLYGQPLEIFTGYLTSIVKIFTGEVSGETLVMIKRLLIYWFLPLLTILNTPTARETKSTLAVILTNLLLFPYTFLGATNIFSNGIAMQLFLISTLSYLNTIPTYADRFRYKNLYNKFSSLSFVVFYSLTHNIGLWILSCLIFSKASKYFLRGFRIIPNNFKKLYIFRTIFFNSIPFILIFILLRRFATSQFFDLTSPITALLAIIFLILMIDLIKRNFSFEKIFEFKSNISKSHIFSQIIFFGLTLTVPAAIFSFISGNDASERLIFLSIMYCSTIIIYFGVQRNILLKEVKIKNFYKINYVLDRALFGSILLLTVITFYFYTTNAFCQNYSFCITN